MNPVHRNTLNSFGIFCEEGYVQSETQDSFSNEHKLKGR